MPIYKMDGKKNGLQKYRVRINYTDSSGKPRQLERVAYGLSAAKELERKLGSGLKQETAEKITLRQLYDEYISVKKNEIRETSLRTVKDRLEEYVMPELGDYYIDKLSTSVLQSWKQYVEECTNDKRPSEKISFTLKKNIYGELRALLNYGVRMEYLPKNPLSAVGNFRNPYETKKEINFYTSDEFLKFIKESRDYAVQSERKTGSIHEWHYYVFFNIAFYTGMRKGEINALKWSDIDGNTIRVRRSIVQKLKGGDRETPPKNKSSVRDLQIPLPLSEILGLHKKRCESLEGFTDDFRVCGGVKCIRDTTIRYRNRLFAEAAGLKAIRIHDFRHSHASLLANNGINIQEIARRLGHSKIEVTWNIYSHLYPKEEERALSVLNEIHL